MIYGVVFEKIPEKDGAPGCYYAHVPALGLTTHGKGIEGARAAALDLLKIWLVEKQQAGEEIPATTDFLFSTGEIPEDALQSA